MANPNLLRRPVPESLNPLPGVADTLFVQAPNAKVEQVAQLCATDQLGAVITIPTGKSRNTTLVKTVEKFREIAGPDATFIADANQYSGNNRSFAGEDLDEDWLKAQWDTGLPWALTNSGYVSKNDDASLRGLLEAGDRLAKTAAGNFMLGIPLDVQLVADRADEVRDLVEQFGIPVAFMLGSASDPLGSHKAVKGLVHLLKSPVPTSLLRTDMSAIGALCAGASIAAMGTSSALRHIFPPANGFGRATGVSAMVPQALSMHRVETIALAMGLTPEELHWNCFCDGCQGRKLDHILDDVQAFRHNIFSTLDIARHAMSGPDSAANLQSWKSTCTAAQFVHMDIASSTGMRWDTPSFLGGWVKL
jgi:hypothetical protein